MGAFRYVSDHLRSNAFCVIVLVLLLLHVYNTNISTFFRPPYCAGADELAHSRSSAYRTRCHGPVRNSFDTVLIPTQLVVDTCYATFVKLEGDKLGEAETKATWERRLAMVASNRNADEGEQEAFVVSKYDLLPESLADMVQVSLSPRGSFDTQQHTPICTGFKILLLWCF